MKVAIAMWAACVACGGSRVEPEQPAKIAAPPVAIDVAKHVRAASKLWLDGDLDAAIRELSKAGGDPHAVALLARAYELAGRPADARRLAQTLPRLPRPELHLLADVSSVDGVAISPDGAFVATIEEPSQIHNNALPSIRVWNTVSGRDLYATSGNRVVFGPGTNGEMLAAVADTQAGKVRVIDAATGAERWAHDIGKMYEVAVDRHNTLTTVSAKGSTFVQWNLSTGAKQREIPNDSNAAVISISFDGQTILGAESLYDLSGTPTKLVVLPPATYSSGIQQMRLSPDGQTIAVTYTDGHIALDGRDGKSRARLDHAGSNAEFLDDGTLVATDGKHLTHWDVTSGESLATADLPKDLRAADVRKLVIGPGGQVVARRGGELVVLHMTNDRANVIANLGFATRADVLAWSHDGSMLAFNSGIDALVWTVAGTTEEVPGPNGRIDTLAFDPGDGLHMNFDAVAFAPQSFWIYEQRVFVRDAAGHAVRFVEAPEHILSATLEAGRLVATGESGVLYIWNADTAEGLGKIEGSPATAIALRPDGRTLAVARETGGIELWDLPSRTRVLTYVGWRDGWLAFTPAGRVDGVPRAVAWKLGDLSIPSDALAVTIEHGLAASVLAHPPAPVAIAPTPAPKLLPHGCVPADVDVGVIGVTGVTVAGDQLAYCLVNQYERGQEPYCFSVDLATKKTTPVSPPLDVASGPHDEQQPPVVATIERTEDASLQVCTPAKVCHTLPVKLDPDPDKNDRAFAVSEDGTLAAVTDPSKLRVETFDVATGKRIAEFKVSYGKHKYEGSRWLQFWSHDVLAVYTPCAGPCSEAFIYTLRGKYLGPYAVESSESIPARFHDDVWVLTNLDGGFAVQDAATGKVLLNRKQPNGEQFAITPDRLVAVIGKPAGKVLVLDRAAKLVTEIPSPSCH